MIGVSISEDPQRRLAQRALREHPDRFFGCVQVDPNRGMDAVRDLAARGRRARREGGDRVSRAASTRRCRSTTRSSIPIYAKCIELDIPICVCAGVPGPRVPFAPQYVGLIDEVCWYFPELKFVTRHGCEPWADLAVKLMLKWPNLYYSTSRVRTEATTPKDIIELREHARRRQGDVRRLLPDGPVARPHLHRDARRAVPRPRLAEVPARERGPRVQAGRLNDDRPAFEAAEAGGVVDTAVGFPKSREEMYEFYEFIRKGQPRLGEPRRAELEFPAGYMFKNVPKWESSEHGRPGRRSSSPSSTGTASPRRSSRVEDETADRAVREHPDRFFASIGIDPNEGMEAVRKIDRVRRASST